VLLRKRLFHPDPKKVETRQSLAANEAVKVKRCLQALRYLWRNAKDSSHDPSVQALKEHLCPSPIQNANAAAAPPPQPSSDEEPIEDESPGSAVEEPPMSPGDVGFGGDIGGGTLSDFEQGESELEGEGDEPVDPSPKQGRVIQQAIRDEGDFQFGSDSEDSLAAPTLQLASQSSEGLDGKELDDEDLRDSQVPGSGWLGQFYAKYGRFGKDENSASFPKCVHQGAKQEMLDEILATLMRFDEDIDKHLCLCFQEFNRNDLKYQVEVSSFKYWVQNGLWETDPQQR